MIIYIPIDNIACAHSAGSSALPGEIGTTPHPDTLLAVNATIETMLLLDPSVWAHHLAQNQDALSTSLDIFTYFSHIWNEVGAHHQ